MNKELPLTQTERVILLKKTAAARAETRRNLEDDLSWLWIDVGGEDW